jgi:hypothetical protein
VSTPISKFFEFFTTVFLAFEIASGVPQGQRFSTLSVAPQWSPIPAPLPAEDSAVLRTGALGVRCLEVNGEGISGERHPAFVDFALRGRQLSRQQI